MRYKVFGLLLILCFGWVASAQDDEIDLPISEDTTYTVRPGDTVDGIGARFDVSPTCIAEGNQLDRNRIFVGDELLISIQCPRYNEDPLDQGFNTVSVPRVVSTFEDDCTGYRVKVNDALDTIAFEFNVSTQSLAIENQLELTDTLQVSQCLTIPTDAPPWGEFPSLFVPALGADGQGGSLPEGTETYIVQPRDNIDSIAAEFNVDVACLANANLLTRPQLLRPGDTLIIDDSCPAYSPFGIAPGALDPAPEAESGS
jgi:LysM repeat protein